MLNLLLMSGVVTTTFHTSNSSGISAFFGGNSWRIETAGAYAFTHTYSPGIPVSSSVKFYTENWTNGQKQMYVTINPGSSNSVSSSIGTEYPVLNFSGVINSLYVWSRTTDHQGDQFGFAVLNIDGSTNYTKINSTTLSIP
tara:strand:- start:2394 stop:2816 length:423 start_codon:yes stop_codon:yes gene_type:complete